MSRIAVLLLLALGLVAGILAWFLPATRTGGVDVPPIAHSLLPVVGCPITLLAAHRASRAPLGRDAASFGATRLLLYLLAAAIAVQALRLSPFVPATFLLAVHACLALGACLLLLGARVARAVPPRMRTAVDLTCGVALFVFAGSEAGLRLIAWKRPQPLFSQVDELPRTRLSRDRPKPGALRFGFPVNADGYVDDAFPSAGSPRPVGERRIAVLGDESLWGHVPHALQPTTVAESLPGPPASYLDFGVPGAGPFEELALLEDDVLGRGVDAVVLTIDVGDDLTDVDRRYDDWRPLALLVDRGNLLLTAVADRVLARLDTPPHPPEQEPWSGADGDWTRDPTLEHPWLGDDALLRRARARVLATWGPGADGRRERLVSTVVAMRDRCARTGVPFGVLLLPAADQLDPALRELSSRERPVDAPSGTFQDWLSRRLASYDILCRDALPALRATAPWSDGRLHVFHDHDTELNARGARIVAGLLQNLARELLGESSR
ncbi:MAG: hypothetical protein IPM29_01240 [Planctomycetes bacterium]|nr:hypothetical protein [Planctomycetota bacterium]